VQLAPVLVIGRAAEAEVLLRSIESGAVSRIQVAGILSPSRTEAGQVLRGVEVIGVPDEVEHAIAEFEARGIRVSRIVMMPSALSAVAKPEQVLMQARRLGARADQPAAGA
jgi:O-antigen biosynthesis protein WbqV